MDLSRLSNHIGNKIGELPEDQLAIEMLTYEETSVVGPPLSLFGIEHHVGYA